MLINARVEDAPKYIHKQPFGNISLICYFLDFMFCDWEYGVTSSNWDRKQTLQGINSRLSAFEQVNSSRETAAGHLCPISRTCLRVWSRTTGKRTTTGSQSQLTNMKRPQSHSTTKRPRFLFIPLFICVGSCIGTLQEIPQALQPHGKKGCTNGQRKHYF